MVRSWQKDFKALEYQVLLFGQDLRHDTANLEYRAEKKNNVSEAWALGLKTPPTRQQYRNDWDAVLQLMNDGRG